MKENIKRLRRQAGLTQHELAAALGYKSQSAVAMWEMGDRKPPSDKIPEIARVLGCSLDDLFLDTEAD